MKLNRFCPLAILLIASIATGATNQPIKVDVNELCRHPKKYNGMRVEVTGYWVTSCAHCSDLYSSFEIEQRKPYVMFVSLGDLRRVKVPRSFRRSWGSYDGYVRLIGTFRFTPIPKWVGEPVPQPSPTSAHTRNQKEVLSEQTAERTIVWGWNGPPVRQIIDITEFQPVGPPIPSHIVDFDNREIEKAMRKYRSSN